MCMVLWHHNQFGSQNVDHCADENRIIPKSLFQAGYFCVLKHVWKIDSSSLKDQFTHTTKNILPPVASSHASSFDCICPCFEISISQISATSQIKHCCIEMCQFYSMDNLHRCEIPKTDYKVVNYQGHFSVACRGFFSFFSQKKKRNTSL